VRSHSIRIIAPAGFATDPPAVDRAVERLAALGHRVRCDDAALGRFQRFAAPDDDRIAAIERAAADADVDIVLMLRGGYGFTRLLDRLDFDTLRRARKHWVGHSDFTAFQLAALKLAGVVTFAGPMAAYDFGGDAISSFTRDQFFGVMDSAAWDVECALDGPIVATQRGVLWGGNLALVAHLTGTRFLPDIDGGILFLEDVGEHPYRIERMLYQLLHAGILGRQRAILLGAFTEFQLNANDAGYDLQTAIAHVRERVATPIYTGLPFGHVRDKLTLPVGGHCELTTSDGRATLRFTDYRQ
jgi:muramoyltetrapeptide carboxypeptidase